MHQVKKRAKVIAAPLMDKKKRMRMKDLLGFHWENALKDTISQKGETTALPFF